MTIRLRLLIRYRPVLRFVKTRILHTDDSPERIARGIAVGLFTAWLPFFGLHVILALFFAAIIRANKAMALLFIWVSNPLTVLFIYYPSYRVGQFILGFFRNTPTVAPKQMETLFEETLSAQRIILEFFTIDLWKQIAEVLMKIGLEMSVGGILLGFIVAKIGYWMSIFIIRRFHNKRQQRRSQLTV